MTDVAIEIDFDIDLDHSPPCEVRLLFTKFCGVVPTVARINFKCPQCGQRDIFFICAPHLNELHNGRQYCAQCGYRAVDGWKVI